MGIFRIHFNIHTPNFVIIRNRFFTALLKTLPAIKHTDPPYTSSDIALCKSLLLFYPIFPSFTGLDQSCLMPTSMFKSLAAGLALTQFPGWLGWEGEGRARASRRTMLHHAKEKMVWAILGFFEVKRPPLARPGVLWCCCCHYILGVEDFQGLSSNFTLQRCGFTSGLGHDTEYKINMEESSQLLQRKKEEKVKNNPSLSRNDLLKK